MGLSKSIKIALAHRANNYLMWAFWKTWQFQLFPNWTRKAIWLLFNNTHNKFASFCVCSGQEVTHAFLCYQNASRSFTPPKQKNLVQVLTKLYSLVAICKVRFLRVNCTELTAWFALALNSPWKSINPLKSPWKLKNLFKSLKSTWKERSQLSVWTMNCVCTELPALCLQKNCTAVSQLEFSNFAMYIINT